MGTGSIIFVRAWPNPGNIGSARHKTGHQNTGRNVRTIVIMEFKGPHGVGRRPFGHGIANGHDPEFIAAKNFVIELSGVSLCISE